MLTSLFLIFMLYKIRRVLPENFVYLRVFVWDSLTISQN
jgi:hypothetical protein